MPGPPPKPAALRQRQNRIVTAAILEAPPAIRIELPAEMIWDPATLDWWDAIWSSPSVSEWLDADVPNLVLLAYLMESHQRKGTVRLAREIRATAQQYGLTPVSRIHLLRSGLHWQSGIRARAGLQPLAIRDAAAGHDPRPELTEPAQTTRRNQGDKRLRRRSAPAIGPCA